MEIVNTIETATADVVEAVEHPIDTVRTRLTSAWRGLESFFGHPYCAPPLQEALTMLHGVVTDLAQEVSELRVPCPCKPAPTSATAAAGDAGQASASTTASSGGAAPAVTAARLTLISDSDLADFNEWKAAKVAATSFAATQA
jgi:hypothetical protein